MGWKGKDEWIRSGLVFSLPCITLCLVPQSDLREVELGPGAIRFREDRLKILVFRSNYVEDLGRYVSIRCNISI